MGPWVSHEPGIQTASVLEKARRAQPKTVFLISDFSDSMCHQLGCFSCCA